MFYFLVFVLGAIIGSFLNVVIWRLHSGDNFLLARSHCPHCREKLKFWDLIPLVSFLALRGNCRYCRKKISWQYPLVELATALLFVLALMAESWQQSGLISTSSGGFFNLHLFSWLLIIRDWIFISFLIIIFVYDFRWSLILDRLTIPAIIIALALNLFLGLPWLSVIIGALVGLGFFALQYLISRGRWIGDGDLRLGALMGLMLGWEKLLVALFFAYILGAIIGIVLLLSGQKKMDSAIPFGTFLTSGTVIALLWGSQLIFWYLNLAQII